MANRALLHINKLKDFEKWLEKQGYMILPTSKNPYEVLRAKKDKDTVIIYQKGDSKEHLSIMDKDYPLIHKFITESKSKTNADRIRNMSDEELAEFIQKMEYTCFVNFIGCANKDCGQGKISCRDCRAKAPTILEWLQSEAE
jgi:hypothetical protein